MEEEKPKVFPALDEVVREFLHGRQYSQWRSRSDSEYHKISASKEWYDYRRFLKKYPGTIMYDDVKWSILELGCGKRRRKDTLLLYRPIELDELLAQNQVNSLDEINHWSMSYRYAEDDEGIFYQYVKMEITYFIESWSSHFDKRFCEWHTDCQLKAYKIEKEDDESEVKEMKCRRGCRPSHCYCKTECDDKNLSYEINEHSMEVEITVGYRSFSLSLDESAELASFLLSAKDKIKEKKIAALEQQQEDLKKQLESVKNL